MSSKDESIKAELGAKTPEFFERFISQHLQQLNEKIDKVRENAGRSL